MPLFKVFDSKREKRKVLKIERITLGEIKKAIHTKFGFQCHKLVLEEDGCEVEDDDVLEELVGVTFVALGGGEEWEEAIKHEAPRSTRVQKGTSSPQTSGETTEATGAAIEGQNDSTSDTPSSISHEMKATENLSPIDATSVREANKLKKLFKEGGIDTILPQINDSLERWKKEPVRFAVIGLSGSGKSTFINALRNVKPGQNGYAQSSPFGDTTTVKKRYKFPGNDMITIDDLPGYGTTRFPKKEYVARMDIQCYDYIMIFVIIIGETDIEFGQQLQKMDVQFCFVRSKLDLDMQNYQLIDTGNKNENMERVFMKIKGKSVEALEKAKLKKVPWFGISSTDRDFGDFGALVTHILDQLQEFKSESVIYSLLGDLTTDLIQRKYEQLKKRIFNLSLVSAAAGAIPIPGLDLTINMGILIAEVLKYTKTFGFDQTIVKERVVLPEIRTKLQKNSLLTSVVSEDEETVKEFVIFELGKALSIMAAQSATDLMLPFIGSLLSGAVAGSVTNRFLHRILEGCRSDALVVYSNVGDHSQKRQKSLH